MLRNLSGQPPQWRRFECTSPMPANPGFFRFAGVDGRGQQDLLREPRNNAGVAVVRIEDRSGGPEGYTFDLFWGNQAYSDRDYRPEYRREPDYRDRDYVPPPRVYGRYDANYATRLCQDSIRQQARDRFRTNYVTFTRVRMDDQPGRNDWVLGIIDVRRWGREESYHFSCSVNFDTGRLRSAQIGERIGWGGGDH